MSIGKKDLRFVLAPWVHYWDSMLVYDETDRTLFSSDLFMQPGDSGSGRRENSVGDIVEAPFYEGRVPAGGGY